MEDFIQDNILVSRVSSDILTYADNNFEKLLQLSPKEYGKVITYNSELESKRYHSSYLNTPELKDINTKNHSYMFSGFTENAVNNDIPLEFKPFLDFVNIGQTVPYNQVTINWFFDKNDFIPYHKDCELGMIKNSNVVIMSFGSTRYLEIKKKGGESGSGSGSSVYKHKIECDHGTIVTLKNQKEYTHRLCKSDDDSPRMSISFRKYTTKL